MASITLTAELIPATQLASSAPTSAPTTVYDTLSPSPTTTTTTTTTSLSSTKSTPSITMATPSPSSSAIPSAGLSTGAKAGIAAASAVGLVVLLSILISLHISYRNRHDPTYRREKDTPLSAYGSAYQNPSREGGAPLLRDGSYMDLSMQNYPNGSPSQHGGSPMLGVGSDDGLSPRRFETNTQSAGSTWLSPTHEHLPARAEEKERWRESHSIAGYFDNRPSTGGVESPRMTKGDKMIAEWNRMEIERAREKSMDREREQKNREHPMAAYQVALPPFFPRGFRDISGETAEPVRNGDHYLETTVHEMDVGVEGRRTQR